VRAADLSDDLERVLYTQEEVADRIAELAGAIDRDYKGRDPLLVGVLNGAVMTMADLCRAMTSHCQMDWMAVSSYGAGTKSSGVVRILKDLTTDIEGRDVLIVEDIIDSGRTLSWLVKDLQGRGPKSLEVVALLRKPDRVVVDVECSALGFEVPDEFIVGYGLDYAERYRTLPWIGALRPEVYS